MILGQLTIKIKDWLDYFKTEEAKSEYESLIPEKIETKPEQFIWNPRFKVWFRERTSLGRITGYDFKNEFMYQLESLSLILEEVTLDVVGEDEVTLHVKLGSSTEYYELPKRLCFDFKRRRRIDDVAFDQLSEGHPNDGLIEFKGLDLTESETLVKIEEKQTELQQLEDKLKLQIKQEEERLRLKISQMQQEMALKLKDATVEVEGLKDHLHLLNTQVYSILSYLGDVVEFKPLKVGIKASKDSPLVIIQKLRYLDEELPQLKSIYDVDFQDAKLFEQLLIEQPLVVDYFLPNEKCVLILKVSRTGIKQVYSHSLRRDEPTVDVMLTTSKLLHGNKVAILVRNGENLHIGWTDDDKITIPDDNLFYTEVTPDDTELTTAEEKFKESDVESYEEGSRGSVALRNIKVLESRYQYRREQSDKYAGRLYIKSILEGLLARKDLIEIPESETIESAIAGKAKHIKFSSADLTLKDTRFGSVKDLTTRINSHETRERDAIYIMRSISGREEYRNSGVTDRTHDAELEDGLNVITKVEKQTEVCLSNGKSYIHCWTVEGILTEEDRQVEYRKALDRFKDRYPEHTKPEFREKRYVYSSAPKRYSFLDARANILIEDSEYVNLTFWNSIWMTYVIKNRETIPGTYSNHFVSQLKHLNEMLKILKGRERQDRLWTLQYVEELPNEWEVLQSEWKMQNLVYNSSEYQAKRFARHLIDHGLAKEIKKSFLRKTKKHPPTYKWLGDEKGLLLHEFHKYSPSRGINCYRKIEAILGRRSVTHTYVMPETGHIVTIKTTLESGTWVRKQVDVGNQYIEPLIRLRLVEEADDIFAEKVRPTLKKFLNLLKELNKTIKTS